MDDGGSIANLMDACMELKRLLRPRSGGDTIICRYFWEIVQRTSGKGDRLMKGFLVTLPIFRQLVCCVVSMSCIFLHDIRYHSVEESFNTKAYFTFIRWAISKMV